MISALHFTFNVLLNVHMDIRVVAYTICSVIPSWGFVCIVSTGHAGQDQMRYLQGKATGATHYSLESVQ